MADIRHGVDMFGTWTTAQGEEWVPIQYPRFRHSDCTKAWKYVSNRGKLMAGDGRVLEARPGKGYCVTSLPVHKDGTYAALANVPLHRIVAYTFLGEPSDPYDTVDHINRVREDNRVANLRWASFHQQMQNREFSSYVVTTTTASSSSSHTYHSLAALARDTGIGTTTLSSSVRHAQDGDVVHVQGTELTVQRVTRKPMASPQSVTANIPPRREKTQPPPPSRKFRAFQVFLQGATVHEISTEMGIAPSTVLTYIGKAARESTVPTLNKLATRIHLESVEARRQLQQAILALRASNESTNNDYTQKYKDMVLAHVPELGDDWPIVQETFQALHKMLDAA